VVKAAAEGVEKLRAAVSRYEPSSMKEQFDTEPYQKQFKDAMDDDFNTPQALATLFDLAREINQAADSGLDFQDAQDELLSLARGVLGLKLPRHIHVQVSARISLKATVDATVIPGKLIPPEHISDTVKDRVKHLAEERDNCRRDRNWQRSDEIRKKLTKLGVTLEDTKAGTDITYKQVPTEESLDRVMEELGVEL
jgi:cysteinyl-tRNA synthetase